MEQSEELFQWYKNKLQAHIDRSTPKRQKVYDIPMEVVSELVKNAIVHRDYSMKGAPIYFEINDESLIIKSPGKPIEPITIPQIQTFNAPSLSRNPLVMFAFDKLDLAEQRGFGFETIRHMPVAQRPKVTFEDPYMVFTLPLVEKVEKIDNLTEREVRGLDFIRTNGRVSRKQYEEAMGLTERTARRDLRDLYDLGSIDYEGESTERRYFVKV